MSIHHSSCSRGHHTAPSPRTFLQSTAQVAWTAFTPPPFGAARPVSRGKVLLAMMLAPYRPADNAMIERPTPTGDPTLARAIARWLRAVDAAALDARVTEKAKLCLLDMI